jgi:hypothetical protein
LCVSDRQSQTECSYALSVADEIHSGCFEAHVLSRITIAPGVTYAHSTRHPATRPASRAPRAWHHHRTPWRLSVPPSPRSSARLPRSGRPRRSAPPRRDAPCARRPRKTRSRTSPRRSTPRRSSPRDSTASPTTRPSAAPPGTREGDASGGARSRERATTRDRPRDICEIQRRRNKRALHPSSSSRAYGSARRPRLTSRPLFLRRTVTVGDVKLGSEHPIVRQTMTTSDTRDVEATVAEVRLPLVISPRACLFFAV